MSCSKSGSAWSVRNAAYRRSPARNSAGGSTRARCKAAVSDQLRSRLRSTGVRALDIRDPYHPKEIASYIPAVTANSDQRCAKLEDGQQHCAKVIQTNNVEVDDRGYIYIVDRANNGMHILELTGPARDAANFPK